MADRVAEDRAAEDRAGATEAATEAAAATAAATAAVMAGAMAGATEAGTAGATEAGTAGATAGATEAATAAATAAVTAAGTAAVVINGFAREAALFVALAVSGAAHADPIVCRTEAGVTHCEAPLNHYRVTGTRKGNRTYFEDNKGRRWVMIEEDGRTTVMPQ